MKMPHTHGCGGSQEGGEVPAGRFKDNPNYLGRFYKHDNFEAVGLIKEGACLPNPHNPQPSAGYHLCSVFAFLLLARLRACARLIVCLRLTLPINSACDAEGIALCQATFSWLLHNSALTEADGSPRPHSLSLATYLNDFILCFSQSLGSVNSGLRFDKLKWYSL
eukprot:COSAG05_NODE_39_length_27555_cov_750.282925_9_plen_165_part_00